LCNACSYGKAKRDYRGKCTTKCQHYCTPGQDSKQV
jgi:hypothetical protein